MTSTIPNKNTSFSEEDEFADPNWNYAILVAELKERIVNLQYDLNNIRDPQVLGYATELYTELKKDYFNLMNASLDLEHDIRIERVLTDIEQRLGGEEDE